MEWVIYVGGFALCVFYALMLTIVVKWLIGLAARKLARAGDCELLKLKDDLQVCIQLDKVDRGKL
jgi:hypothetical protein